jgi:hypothetical protein
MGTLALGIYKPAHRIDFAFSIMEHNLRMFKPVMLMTTPVFIPGAHIIKTYRHSPTYKIQITKFLERKKKLKKN